jgi:MoaA/NifB/PqqE/SkfB family radical SAM enzyme
MNIIEVKQNWPNGYMRIHLELGNICNYKCWYCWPGSNEGTHKWPDFDLLVKNLSHVLDYYIEHTDKRKFDFNLLGGEVTHWKHFIDFIKYFKERYDCIFTLTTNGSKKLSWWEAAAPYLDYVGISSHHEFADLGHLRNLADLLYKKNVIVVVKVLMDPYAWDKCMDAVEYYKGSEKRWTIRYLEIIEIEKVNYTEAQNKIIGKLRARGPNLFWFFKNNKSYRSKVTVVDDKNKTHKIKDHEIVLDRLNNFKGWECNVGIDWIAITIDGNVSGICGNPLYGKSEILNILDPAFTNKFHPTIKPGICEINSCWCSFETNMPKKKLNSSNKIIPIYAN